MPTIVHFDVASDDVERAKKFYEGVFNWKFDNPPGFSDYYLIETEGLDGEKGPGGGLGKRGDPSQQITVHIGVDSIDDYAKRIEAAGGMITVPKMAVPGWGYLALCQDTEGNAFGLWEEDGDA
jgi:hypothetical protein